MTFWRLQFSKNPTQKFDEFALESKKWSNQKDEGIL
jgi:hypothetical protein